MEIDLEQLALAAVRHGWASVAGADVELLRTAAKSLGWREVATRRGDPAVSVLKPASRDAARPNSLSAVHGMSAQPLHTDGAHLPRPPDLVVLVCETSTETPTQLWNTRWKKRGQPAPHQALRHGIFLVRDARDSFLSPVLSRGIHRFDPGCMVACDARAQEASAYFSDQLQYAESHSWVGPETLLIDNTHVLHARSEVTAGDEDRVLNRICFTTGGGS